MSCARADGQSGLDGPRRACACRDDDAEVLRHHGRGALGQLVEHLERGHCHLRTGRRQAGASMATAGPGARARLLRAGLVVEHAGPHHVDQRRDGLRAAARAQRRRGTGLAAALRAWRKCMTSSSFSRLATNAPSAWPRQRVSGDRQAPRWHLHGLLANAGRLRVSQCPHEDSLPRGVSTKASQPGGAGSHRPAARGNAGGARGR
jgi:hypothetical protein